MKDYFRLGTAEIDEMHDKIDEQLQENTEDAKVTLTWLKEISQNVAALARKANLKQELMGDLDERKSLLAGVFPDEPIPDDAFFYEEPPVVKGSTHSRQYSFNTTSNLEPKAPVSLDQGKGRAVTFAHKKAESLAPIVEEETKVKESKKSKSKSKPKLKEDPISIDKKA